MFYRNSILSVLVLFVFLVLSLFYMNIFYAKYRFITYSTYLLETANLQNSYYYIPSGPIMEENGSEEVIKAQGLAALRDIIHPSILGIRYQDNIINMSFCSSAYIDAFRFVDEGHWFSDPELEAGAENCFDVVVCGDRFSHLQVGDRIVLNGFQDDDSMSTIEARVIGKKHTPAYLPTCNYGSLEVAARNLFEFGHNSMLMTEESMEKLLQSGQIRPRVSRSANFFVRLKEDATEEEKAEAVFYMMNNGVCFSREELLDYSRTDINETIKLELPKPLLLLLVSSFTMFSISILTVTKKMKELRYYYLCGCSKGRSLLLMLAAIGIPAVLAGALNVGFVLLYPALMGSGVLYDISLNFYYMIMSGENIIAIAFYCVCAVLLSVLVPFHFIRKSSPTELFRR